MCNTTKVNMSMHWRVASMDVVFILLVFILGVSVAQSNVNIQIGVEAEEEVVRQFLVNIIQKANLTTTSNGGSPPSYEFSILTGDYEDNFVVELNSDLFMKERVDRDAICEKQLVCEILVQIGATSGTTFKVIDVTVTIIDKNDNAPTFASRVKNFTIPEETSLGISYELPLLKDADIGINSIQQIFLEPEGVSFELEQTEDSFDGSFVLNLIPKISLDRELWDNYQLYVKAVDGGNPKQTGMLTVNIVVSDINDNKPKFNQDHYNTTIDEDIEKGTGIINVTASDRDIGENARLTYFFSGMNPSSISNSISIRNDTGEIYLQEKFDSETGPFTLYVKARDNGNPVKQSSPAVVVIHVKDKNDNPPVIQLTKLIMNDMILENATIGKPVAHIRVVDADTGRNGEAVCTCNNTNFSIHNMSVNTFRIDVAAKFDREVMDRYQVTVNCSDQGEPSLSASEDFEVIIGDINDHVPKFTQDYFSANVSENNAIGAVLIRVTATDLDIGPNAEIEYRILPFVNSSLFNIDRSQGIIKAVQPLDRETVDYYNFTVTASNPGVSDSVDIANVIIRVLDTNDQIPDFRADSYAMSVMENSPNGTSTGAVSADDKDLGVNGEVSYMITTKDVPFKVLDDGTVVTTQKLNRESVENYEFRLVAYDHGNPSRQSAIPVYVIVLDVNDNAPYLDFPYGDNDSVSVAHTKSPDSVITRIIANDADEDNNKLLTYNITSGNDDNIFSINSNTGDVILAKQILAGDVKTYSLTILVKDKGTPPLETRATLRIKFYIANDTAEHALAFTASGQKNILIAIIISSVTLVLSIIIIAVICILRRKDPQKDLFNSKAYDEQRIMSDLHRNSNRSSSSRGSQDKMITADSHYIENGFQNKKNKKEVSFSLDEETDGVVSMEPMSNGHFDPVSTFKSPSPLPSESPVYEPKYKQQEKTSPLRQEDAKQREIHRMTSLRVHQALMKTNNNNNNKLWSQSSQEEPGKSYHGLSKSHLEDTHSETSGEATASDSGRGGSEEDIRSSVTNSHDTDESRSPNTSSSHPFYATDSQKPSFSSFHGNNVHRTGPILSSFTGKPRNTRGNEDLYMKNSYPLNDLSSPNRSVPETHTNRLSGDSNYIPTPANYSALQFTPGFGLTQNKRDSDPLLDLSMQSNIQNSEIDSVAAHDDDDNTTTSGSYTINDIQDDILPSEVKEDMFYKPDTFV